jgi:ubiquinone/menaquinone biosynthesis C-methylase UbiE
VSSGLEYSERITKQYLKNREKFTPTDTALFLALAQSGVHGQILDYGGGDGRYARRLIQMGGKSVVVLDASFSMIQQGRHRRDNQRATFFEVARGENIPHPNECFDLVFSNFVFHYMLDSARAFTEVFRVLQKGARLIATFSDFWIYPGHKHLENTIIPLSFANGTPISTLIKSGSRMKKEVLSAGFAIKHYELLNNPAASIARGYKWRGAVKFRTALLVAEK